MEDLSIERMFGVVETIRSWSYSMESFKEVLRETERGLDELSKIISELKILTGSNNRAGGEDEGN